MLTDASRFLHEVFAHWLAAWGGIGLMVIAMIEAARGKKVSKRWFFGLAWTCLAIAMFQAWRDEYTSAEWRGREIRRLSAENARLRSDYDASQRSGRTEGVDISGVRERARKKAVRERLGGFVPDGTALRDKVARAPTDTKVLGEIEQWRRRVEAYLRSSLDMSYVERFRTVVFPATSPWANMVAQIAQLEKFIELNKD